ncbi:hypothetical protein DE146DRAFT_751520 [Phaeosphaeria sp. MPI-PUGE-AT-0046c]|nr:hypothetical protein DE146DRAFT_751520 [Phaeosphaeria sp. MPI-PUGE-AT-0046c]
MEINGTSSQTGNQDQVSSTNMTGSWADDTEEWTTIVSSAPPVPIVEVPDTESSPVKNKKPAAKLDKATESSMAFVMDDLAVALPSDQSATGVPSFTLFNQLPPELRAEVIDSYLMMEREDGRLSKHCHYDGWGSRCCVWEYPDLLIACDNQDPETFPSPTTGRTPEGWMPALAFTDKAMLGEVTVHMLQHTSRFDLKYISENPDFKIATWFREFLESIPGGNNTVQYLNFPHMHRFNSMRSPPALTNPSVDLMAACKNLRKVDMTFHASVLHKGLQPDSEKYGSAYTAQELVDRFHLEPVLECEKLEEVYFHDRAARRRLGRLGPSCESGKVDDQGLLRLWPKGQD